jgi:hypothetical protein
MSRLRIVIARKKMIELRMRMKMKIQTKISLFVRQVRRVTRRRMGKREMKMTTRAVMKRLRPLADEDRHAHRPQNPLQSTSQPWVSAAQQDQGWLTKLWKEGRLVVQARERFRQLCLRSW